MLDTKNHYGGILHVCYAPEFETLNDTRQKLLQRQKNVVARLKNLNRTAVIESAVKTTDVEPKIVTEEVVDKKLYMGNENNIGLGKRKADFVSVKHCKLKKSRNFDRKHCVAVTENVDNKEVSSVTEKVSDKEVVTPKVSANLPTEVCEIVDFTSTEDEVLTNINEHLNYNNFGKEIIKKVPYKPVNKIKFNINQSNS